MPLIEVCGPDCTLEAISRIGRSRFYAYCCEGIIANTMDPCSCYSYSNIWATESIKDSRAISRMDTHTILHMNCIMARIVFNIKNSCSLVLLEILSAAPLLSDIPKHDVGICLGLYRGPERPHKHKDPTNHGFGIPLVLGPQGAECRILLCVRSLGPLRNYISNPGSTGGG